MGEKKTRILMWLVPLVILISLTGGVSLYSQFLADEEEEKIEEKKPVKEKKDIIPDNIARNIKAEFLPEASGEKCAIKITWDLNPKYSGEYVVARSDQVTDTVEKARKARVVQTVKGSVRNAVTDPDCTPGSYYYVILSKNSITENMVELYPDSNYMTAPLVVGPNQNLPMVFNIRAVETDDLKVRLTWDRAEKSAMFYTIHRSRQVINTESRLKESERLDTQVDIGDYLDQGVATGIPYYYAVTVKALNGKENRNLVPGRNYTTAGVLVTAKKEEKKAVPVKIKSIGARAENEEVLVTWDYSGAGGETYYRLFRSVMQVTTVGEVSSRDILGSVNVKDLKYRDAAVPAGSYYYGLIPGTGTDLSGYRLVPGVNITRSPVIVKIKEEKQERQLTVIEPDDIDRILKRTFFRGRYHEAIKELSGLVDAGSSGQVAAKARLFMGRSNIELGRYRKALDFLLLPEVKKYFPKDADFWISFALTRIMNH